MSLQTDIETAMRAAMKAGDAPRVSTLRMAMAANHNRQIELGSGPRSTADTGTSTIKST